MDEARRAVPDLLAAGRSVALVADQDARSRGLDVTFLGRAASTFRGPARLALATRAPLVFGVALREEDGYVARIEPVWVPGATDAGGTDPDEFQLTSAWVGRLERWVRERPEQYFWFHRRWKSGGGGLRNEGGPDAVPQA
jgi:KDO2-lipid IV(A) lauroyltransferase